MKRIIIFANGELPDSNKALLLLHADDYIICADGGTRHAVTLAVQPDLIIGDMDSLEKGKLEKFHDEKLGISANQYAEKVDFVQVVKLKAKAKTSLAGTVEFQTCDDKKCLPPKKVNFSIAII